MGILQQKDRRNARRPPKLVQPFPALELRVGKIMDMRLLLTPVSTAPSLPASQFTVCTSRFTLCLRKCFKNVLGTRLEGTFECKARLENADFLQGKKKHANYASWGPIFLGTCHTPEARQLKAPGPKPTI